MTHKLYRTPVPEGALNSVEPSVQRRLAQSGILSGGTSSENIAGEPGTLRLDGSYMGKYAELLATELRELLQSDMAFVPLYDDAGTIDEAGYYTIERGDSGRATPQSGRVATFAGQLVRDGTRASRWVATRTNPTEVSNDFGNDTTAYIGVPAVATKVRWFNPETRERAGATVQATRTAEYGDVEIYDAQASPYAKPALIYDIAYADIGNVDVGVWDSHGRSKTNANGTTTWSRVFDTAHDYDGEVVLDDGLLRLTIDEAANTMSAEWWDDPSLTWEPRALGPVHNPLDSLTNITTGSNATATTVSSPTKDGTAVQATTDSSATVGNRDIIWTPTSAIDLSAAGDLSFWAQVDKTLGPDGLTLTDSAGTSETVDYGSQLFAGSMEYVTVATSNYTTVDLTAITEVRWTFDGDGSGILRTLTIDRFAGTSPWEVFDVDVTSIGMATVEATIEFRDSTQSPTAYYTLEAVFTHGETDIQWLIPENEPDPVPTGLVDFLDPIANTSVIDPGAAQELLAREEAR